MLFTQEPSTIHKKNATYVLLVYSYYTPLNKAGLIYILALFIYFNFAAFGWLGLFVSLIQRSKVSLVLVRVHHREIVYRVVLFSSSFSYLRFSSAVLKHNRSCYVCLHQR